MQSQPLARLLLILLFPFASAVHAQAACPPGLIPYGAGNDLSTCGPDDSQQQPQMLPSPQWSRRWGAIATDSVNGSLGTITGVASRSEAEQIALAICRVKGGSQCKLDISYSNGCGAMVVGDGGYNSNSAATMDEAVNIGIGICRRAGHANCHVYYSACSPPERIR